MITLDISNIWGQVSLPDLLAMEKTVAQGFATLQETEAPEEVPLAEILDAAQRIRACSQACVVLSSGDGALGARAVLEALETKTETEVLFAGDSLSTRQWNRLLARLEGKEISLIAISQGHPSLESAIALRNLRWMLERKYGTDQAKRRIFVVTGDPESALSQMARTEGWTQIPTCRDGGVLTAAGLLPMAVAGVDIAALVAGAREAWEGNRLGSFENPVWLYAAVRTLLSHSGKTVERFLTFDSQLAWLGIWWQQLFSKAGGAIFPAAAQFPAQEEPYSGAFETFLRMDLPGDSCTIEPDWQDLDGLNVLSWKSLSFVEAQACTAAISAHTDGGVPVLTMDCGPLTEETLGALLAFFTMARDLCNAMAQPPEEESGYVQALETMLGAMAQEG